VIWLVCLYIAKALLYMLVYSFWCAGVVFGFLVKVVKNLVSRYLNLRNIAGRIANSVGIVTSLWSIKSCIPVDVWSASAIFSYDQVCWSNGVLILFVILVCIVSAHSESSISLNLGILSCFWVIWLYVSLVLSGLSDIVVVEIGDTVAVVLDGSGCGIACVLSG